MGGPQGRGQGYESEPRLGVRLTRADPPKRIRECLASDGFDEAGPGSSYPGPAAFT